MRTIIFAAVTMAVLAGAGTAYGAGSAPNKADSSTRPASIPSDYVFTPFGYFSPKCVIALGKDEVGLPGGDIRDGAGNVRKPAPCAEPRYLGDGTVASKATPPAGKPENAPLDISTWQMGTVMDLTTRFSIPYDAYQMQMTVPTVPALNGPTLYFFTVLQASDIATLQPDEAWIPALAFNQAAHPGKWSAALWWNPYVNGNVYLLRDYGIFFPGDQVQMNIKQAEDDGFLYMIAISKGRPNSDSWYNESVGTGPFDVYIVIYPAVYAVDSLPACDQTPGSVGIYSTFTNPMPYTLSPIYWQKPGGCMDYDVSIQGGNPVYLTTLKIHN
ncbi:hypothetical protein [Phyllobacterium leguminum]|uniref:Polysaccharide lyase-like protein n=1 Tax=Phyllobacterium leguminum TaxID=314237 RepID=A0A318SWR6_9HYPH|nr:hypothetical protein [Phyllobacterium leguminum]PYE86411.1 hypothetical protein C7477_1254 [Phyllobacterium leguminum]